MGLIRIMQKVRGISSYFFIDRSSISWFFRKKMVQWQQKDIKGGKYFMDKKKLLTASLASVAVLGAGFLASHPSVVKAE